MALLIGDKDQQQRLAEGVRKICRELSVDDVDDVEQWFWIHATEGETCLLQRDSDSAVRFYAAALATPHAANLGMVKPMYNQVCRLYWALGEDVVQPVVDELVRRKLTEKLEPGPFGDCGRNRAPIPSAKSDA